MVTSDMCPSWSVVAITQRTNGAGRNRHVLYDRRMDDLERALHRAAGLIADYRRNAADARVSPVSTREAVASHLDPTLPEGPTPIDTVIDELVRRRRRA